MKRPLGPVANINQVSLRPYHDFENEFWQNYKK